MKQNLLLLIILLYFTPIVVNGQSKDYKTFNSLTFFYVDNSEGFGNDTLSASISTDAAQEFKKRLFALSDKGENFFLLIGSDGRDPKLSTNVKSLMESEWLKSYFNKTSQEADYGIEKALLREQFVLNPIKIKRSVDVHLFLSSYSISQFQKRLEEFPVPLYFMKELPIYLYNSDLEFDIHIYCSQEIVYKLGTDKIKNYFNFCSNKLKTTDDDVEILAF